ncbi:serine/threonine-protein kinase [Streptomyces sp. NY05-11A]|uniref:serine/threonine-protein kinase n=1 Tax=Streptomyces soliscabiei TaxID=588897 RepID=UPI0029A0F9B9|nr:serine/threonine-protein kinase [Streptomyces sp. NY05-11A]MDX2678336.1 serine/threonine-protein kinase [Streptomyces sp. NY05-11A]
MSTGEPHRRVVDGRFELVERLGGGGMGLVWRAHDLALHRDVAVKEVRPPDPDLAEYDPEGARTLRERVLREARALARVHHPNVVTIHHIVDGGGYTYPWIVMELVEGGSLQNRLERGPMTPVEAARVGRGVLSALRAAHAVGIEHRDVKPANVLLRPDGRPVLTDFGIAAVRESAGLTATGAVIGSPDFMAPERVSGKEGGPAADLWSLAMLLYVAVEGHHPLRRASTLATLAAVLGEDVPVPLRAGPLTGVLTALLVRDPEVRPDAAEVDRMLAAVTEDAPAPPGWAPQSQQSQQSQQPRQSQQAQPTSYPLAPAAAPAAVTLTPTQAGGPGRGRRLRAAAVTGAVVAVALTGVLVWVLLPQTKHSDTGSASTTSPSPSPSPSQSVRQASSGGSSGAAAAETVDLLTGDGVRTTVKKLTAAMGGTKVTSLAVYGEYAIADAPVAGHPKLYDRYIYRGGDVAVKDGPGGTVMGGGVPVDLDLYDWDAVPALLARAGRTLGVPKPTNRYLMINPASTVFHTDPSMSVYLSDDYGSAYLRADVRGRVIETHPREDG